MKRQRRVLYFKSRGSVPMCGVSSVSYLTVELAPSCVAIAELLL
jgi:hypothetical protein